MHHKQKEISAKLLSWYDKNHRKLPWRETPSLYRTIVSEFMLQQTQVKTMLPYFDRWMAVFPDFEALAASEESAVVKMWEGLGYYRRARNLRKLAQQWVKVSPKPITSKEWMDYPGVGPYMAAAIASIQFEEPTVVVDGNVVRVMARMNCVETTFPSSGKAVTAIRPVAQELMPVSRVGDFNQALMELGAIICRPKSPQCLICPWFDPCKARLAGCHEEIPKVQKPKIEKIEIPRMLVIDRKNHRILLQAGGLDGRLDGIYELPPISGEFPKDHVGEKVDTIKRGISNQQITEPIYRISETSYKKWVHKKTEPEWIPFKNLGKVSLSGPHRKWTNDFLSSNEDSY